MTPSNSMYSSGWSSTGTASRFSLGSYVGPFGTAHDFKTPPISNRKSQCLLDDKSQGLGARSPPGRLGTARGLRGLLEFALALVFFQAHAHKGLQRRRPRK